MNDLVASPLGRDHFERDRLRDDVDATAKAVAEHGGKVEFEPMTVGENGRSTMLKDPGGAMLGAWQPGTQKGFEVTGEPGTPTWFELHTRDYGKSVSFYRDVFKWDAHAVSDTDEFRYTTLGEGDGQLAGIMDDSPYPGDDPAHWAIYFKVEDADATLEKVVALGGKVVQAAEDTPYGRLAQADDPTGAVFRIVAG